MNLIFRPLIFIALACLGLSGCIKTSYLVTKDGEGHYIKEFGFKGHYFTQVGGNLYGCETEVTNSQYKKFLNELAAGNPQKHAACVVDTGVWRKYPFGDSVLSRHYWQHAAFQPYPVVGISWQAANEYCNWLSSKTEKYQFRLPTKQEWQLLVAKPDSRGFDFCCPNGYDSVVKMYCFNFWVVNEAADSARDGGYFAVRADAYWPNSYGIYNLHGNVAEMTSDSTVCKGGGWNDTFDGCSMFSNKSYVLPSAEVGFRVVAVKIK